MFEWNVLLDLSDGAATKMLSSLDAECYVTVGTFAQCGLGSAKQ